MKNTDGSKYGQVNGEVMISQDHSDVIVVGPSRSLWKACHAFVKHLLKLSLQHPSQYQVSGKGWKFQHSKSLIFGFSSNWPLPVLGRGPVPS